MTGHVILAVLAVAVVAVLVDLASPVRTCARCKGERITRRRLTKKPAGCPRCKATGQHYRRGAAAVHRARWALRNAIASELEERRQARNRSQR